MDDLIERYWGALVVCVGFVSWLVRMEARGFSNAKAQRDDREQLSKALKNVDERHAVALEKLEARWIEQRREDIETRRREWDAMRGDLSELKADIKKLLERSSQ